MLFINTEISHIYILLLIEILGISFNIINNLRRIKQKHGLTFPTVLKFLNIFIEYFRFIINAKWTLYTIIDTLRWLAIPRKLIFLACRLSWNFSFKNNSSLVIFIVFISCSDSFLECIIFYYTIWNNFYIILLILHIIWFLLILHSTNILNYWAPRPVFILTYIIIGLINVEFRFFYFLITYLTRVYGLWMNLILCLLIRSKWKSILLLIIKWVSEILKFNPVFI